VLRVLIFLILCVPCTRARAADLCAVITRQNVARCAVDHSLSLRHEQLSVSALAGREKAQRPLLPSNPELSLSAAHRSAGSQRATNWNATLSQELEVSGRRSALGDAAGADKLAQERSALVTARDVAREALHAYFEALAARDALDTAERLERMILSSSRATDASAARGLSSGLDAQIAELIGVRLTQARIAAERQQRTALSALASLLGQDPGGGDLSLNGELEPLARVGDTPLARVLQLTAAAAQRPELGRAEQLRRARALDVRSNKRSRIPNPRVSVFAQDDGFDERVLGAGLAVPIPLPYPLGQTAHGQIAEAEALLRQAETDIEAVQRGVRLELAVAQNAYRAAEQERALYTAERVERAEQSLGSLADSLRAGRMSISEAVVAQQTLVEFLRAQVAAKLELCLASIELARAAGLSLESGDL